MKNCYFCHRPVGLNQSGWYSNLVTIGSGTRSEREEPVHEDCLELARVKIEEMSLGRATA